LRDDHFAIWPVASLALSYLKVKQENVVDGFIERIQKNPSGNLIHRFGIVAEGNQKAADLLLGLLQNNDIESYVIWALGNIGVRNEHVLKVNKLLNQKLCYLYFVCFYLLTFLVLKAMYSIREKETEMTLRKAWATIALGKLGESNMTEDLLALLEFKPADALKFNSAETVRRESGRALHILVQKDFKD
jgi:hypothetical protein